MTDDLDAEWQQLQRDHFRQAQSARRPQCEPVNDSQAIFAANLRALRARRRLTQRALAEQLGAGFTASTIARWETLGPPQQGPWLDRWVQLAKFFGVSLDEFLRRYDL